MNHKHATKAGVTYIFLISFILPTSLFAGTKDDFIFGNHIDTHQSTILKAEGGEPIRLNGDFLIIFTGETDQVSGLPIARHPKGADQDGQCGDDIECEVGWDIKAVPGEAKFVLHTGVNGKDHPVWLVNRTQIPQPGSYTHFHWITYSSNDPRRNAVPPACDAQSAGDLENVAEGVTCPGWFMQITAVQSFAFQHGNEIVPVNRGVDNATHLNLLTNYAEVLDITPTR